jgi:hypothetical protein
MTSSPTPLREQIEKTLSWHGKSASKALLNELEALVASYIEAAEINGAITQLVNYRMVLRNTEKLIPTDHEYGHGKRDGQIQITEELGEIITDLQAQKAALSEGTK